MNEISCGVCRDLIPLVKNSTAGEESRLAVERHTAACPACRELLGTARPPIPDAARDRSRLSSRLRTGAAMAMVFGLFFGLSLTEGSDMLYNVLIMPVAGALAYAAFRWHALYALPGLTAAIHFAANWLSGLNGREALGLTDLVYWTGVYCLLALLGTLAAGLLHFAFRKEEGS